MSKKILIITDSIDSNGGSGPKANLAIIRNLIKTGYQVKVLHYSFKEISVDGAACELVKERKAHPNYFIGRFVRILARFTGLNLNRWIEPWIGFSFTFKNDSGSMFRALRKNETFNPHLVITLSQASSFRPHHALLRLPQWYARWIAYVHDPYPFHFYPRPYNWVQPGYRQKETFFKEVSERAAYSAFPSQLLLKWMGSYFPAFLKTGIVIPHQLESPVNHNTLDSNGNSRFNLLHAGNLLKQRDPKGLIEGYKLFLEKNPEALTNTSLTLSGPADYHASMIASLSNGIKNIEFNNRNIPFEEMLSIQQNTSVNIILESNAEISPFLPGKFPHCVEANQPILLLGPYYSECRRLLGETYPYWAEQDNPQAIAEQIKSLYTQWKNDPQLFKLNRTDLVSYLGANHLDELLKALPS